MDIAFLELFSLLLHHLLQDGREKLAHWTFGFYFINSWVWLVFFLLHFILIIEISNDFILPKSNLLIISDSNQLLSRTKNYIDLLLDMEHFGPVFNIPADEVFLTRWQEHISFRGKPWPECVSWVAFELRNLLEAWVVLEDTQVLGGATWDAILVVGAELETLSLEAYCCGVEQDWRGWIIYVNAVEVILFGRK